MNKSKQSEAKPSLYQRMTRLADIAIERDPAARSRLEVILLYPSFHALLFHRLAHRLYRRNFYFMARWISQFSRFLTGIEIHPGAQIGEGFFIDHGMGVVIGETAQVGDRVTLYHGVTLGGVSPSEDSDSQRTKKRHPTLEDDVIVGSGAQILGSVTIGKGARVGANAVVVHDVMAGETVIGIPANPVKKQKESRKKIDEKQGEVETFDAYGLPKDCMVKQGDYDALITKLEARIKRLEQQNKPTSTKK